MKGNTPDGTLSFLSRDPAAFEFSSSTTLVEGWKLSPLRTRRSKARLLARRRRRQTLPRSRGPLAKYLCRHYPSREALNGFLSRLPLMGSREEELERKVVKGARVIKPVRGFFSPLSNSLKDLWELGRPREWGN